MKKACHRDRPRFVYNLTNTLYEQLAKTLSVQKYGDFSVFAIPKLNDFYKKVRISFEHFKKISIFATIIY